MRPRQLAGVIKLQHQELAVPRRVVVHRRLRVAKGLERRARREDPRLDALALSDAGPGGGKREKVQHLLGGL